MGGQKQQPAQVIQAPAQPPAPSPSETTAQSMEAQLKYNPQLYEQYAKSYAQYLPQLTGAEFDIQKQYAPQLQALQQQMYPQQTQLVEALSRQALQRMQSPYGYTPEEQSSIDAIRQRETQRLQQGVRERQNLGGTLYGGRGAQAEQEATSQLAQAFAQEDINRRLQGSQQALQYATPALQIQYPQISPAQVPNYWQSGTPSADQIYQAMYGSTRQQYGIMPGAGGGGGNFGGLGTGLGMLGGALLAAPTGGLSIPMGAMIGGGLGGGVGSMFRY